MLPGMIGIDRLQHLAEQCINGFRIHDVMERITALQICEKVYPGKLIEREEMERQIVPVFRLQIRITNVNVEWVVVIDQWLELLQGRVPEFPWNNPGSDWLNSKIHKCTWRKAECS